MHVWFRWIFYLNPGAYAFEALMANEFVGLELECVAPDYIPYGMAYNDAPASARGCSVLGSDGNTINGAAYIREQYSYSVYHIWRSFGIIVGFWAFFIFLTSVGFELRNSQGGSSVLLYKRGSQKKRTADEEATPKPKADAGALTSTVKQSTFTWNNLDYHVPFHGQKKQLLDQVFGYVKPGNLVALMGCSGAGKTTYVSLVARRRARLTRIDSWMSWPNARTAAKSTDRFSLMVVPRGLASSGLRVIASRWMCMRLLRRSRKRLSFPRCFVNRRVCLGRKSWHMSIRLSIFSSSPISRML
jgi:hypothetical protein